MTTTAKVFKNGRSQVVRLPREFRFEGDRVRVGRVGRGVLVEPMFTDVSIWFAELDRLATEPFLPDGRQQPTARRRIQRAVSRDSVIRLSSIVAFELWYGVGKSQRKESNTQRLEAFFAGPLEWTPFDDHDAREAGTVRAELEAAGKLIGVYDVLLAGQARRRGATLVTSNVKELVRVAGLKWEDWG